MGPRLVAFEELLATARPLPRPDRAHSRPESRIARGERGVESWRSSRRTRISARRSSRTRRVRPLLVVGAGRDQPDRGRGRRGPLLLGLRRQALPRLRLAARQRQHRPPAPEDRRGDQGAGRQARTIGPPMATESRSRLGRLLAEVTPGDLCMSFFTNGGAEANENAIKLARLVPGGTRSSRATARTTARPPGRSCSPATRAAGRTSRGWPASCGCSTRTRTAAPRVIRTRARSAPARRTSRRSSSTRARTPSPR